MRKRLSFREKVYVVALFGDISEDARARLFRLGRLPVHLTAVLAESRARTGYINAVAARPKPPRTRRGKTQLN